MLSQMLVRILRYRLNCCRQRNRSVSTNTLDRQVILARQLKVNRTKPLCHAFNSYEKKRKEKETKMDLDQLSASHQVPLHFIYLHKSHEISLAHTHTQYTTHNHDISINFEIFFFFILQLKTKIFFDSKNPTSSKHTYRIYKLWWS